MKLYEHDEAIQYLDKSIELDPTNSDAYNLKGHSLWSLKNYEDAILLFNKANELNLENLNTFNCNDSGESDVFPRYKCLICFDYNL